MTRRRYYDPGANPAARRVPDVTAPAAPRIHDGSKALTGTAGRAEPIDLANIPRKHPDHHATLGAWFLSLPGAHPFWPEYVLTLVHLRDMIGQSKPPHRSNPAASHELLLVALNVPEHGPFSVPKIQEQLRGQGITFLLPPNCVTQADLLTDAQALVLLDLIARALVDGRLPAELDDYLGAHDLWRRTIATTAEHIRLGTHPGSN